jgi:hypothetical protein
MHAVHNARVQLFATALNNLGVGAILAGIVAPLVNRTVGDPRYIAAWLIFGADLLWLAQVWLGRLRTRASRPIGWSCRWSGSSWRCPFAPG